MKPSEKILAGRELIARNGGWVQHAYNGPGGAMCILAAVNATEGGPWVASPQATYLERVVHPLNPEKFNNTHTQLECVVALEKAALLAMSEGQ